MVTTASNVISDDPWLLAPTGGAIGLTAFALALLGDVVRDASSPASAGAGGPRVRSGAGSSPRPGTATGPSPALLEVSGLSVAFPSPAGSVPVLQDVSFSVAPGETLGLVGESGCGKSVTARAVLGLLPDGGRPTAGSVRWDGVELVGLSQRELRRHRGSGISLISQESIASLDPTRTVGAQLAQVVRLHDPAGRADVKGRVLQLLEQVRLPDPAAVARKYPHQLSGGMAQRICIAIALAGRPRLLIADEPTTALDVTVQAEILDLLRSLQRQTGMAVLLVTHDWGVVADVCDRALVMYAGQVVEQATTDEVFDLPLHPYTSGLLQSDPHAAGVPPRGELPSIPGSVPPPGSWPSGCHFAARCPLVVDACRSGPVPLVEPEQGRASRCLRVDELRLPALPAARAHAGCGS
jgi:peptide/nickel transport system permease protein